ncbi:MAG: group II intron reverse transcriptase/maturase, partial [Candidatus Scalindua sp.]|nr:group II intron reverse transcriptase/maturase [Candidatus Scalindua sp.]
DILENRVKPAVQSFLAQRGLSLSEEKTHITHINTGFDFLGFNLRKYKEKLLIKPTKASIKRVLVKVRELIKSQATVSAVVLIQQLNPIIRGWANYFRHVVSKDIFSRVDKQIFNAIYRWIRRKHKGKNGRWLKRRYFTTIKMNHWRFFAWHKDAQGNVKQLLLYNASYTPIKRHVKVRAVANPFLKEYVEYFEKRSAKTSIKPWWALLHLLPVQFSDWT